MGLIFIAMQAPAFFPLLTSRSSARKEGIFPPHLLNTVCQALFILLSYLRLKQTSDVLILFSFFWLEKNVAWGYGRKSKQPLLSALRLGVSVLGPGCSLLPRHCEGMDSESQKVVDSGSYVCAHQSTQWSSELPMLVNVLSIWQKAQGSGKREPQLRQCLHQTGL